MLKTYGFSSLSSFTMLKVAVLKPVALGLKVTLKVVEPDVATEAEGLVEIEKSAALVPENEIAPMVKVPVPVFSMVKVFTTVPTVISVEPKSVSSDREGVISPVFMELLFPRMFISGAEAQAPPPETLKKTFVPKEVVPIPALDTTVLPPDVTVTLEPAPFQPSP